MQQLTLDGGPPKKRAKKGGKFAPHHLGQYGLKVSSVNPTTLEVETVACRFCIAFGREVGPTTLKATGKTRAGVSTKKLWGVGQLRCDLFTKHHESQHASKWAEYQSLPAADKEKFVASVPVPFVETLPASFETEQQLKFVVSTSIIDVIIGELLFHPDDVSIQTNGRERALAVFEPVSGKYHIIEKHPSRFRLCIRFMARGVSFRMAAGLLDDVKEETDISRYSGCTEQVAASYARVICAVSLERLSTAMRPAWAVSFALDSATHQGKSYVDVRCRFSTNGSLHNFHLLAIPLHHRHTAENLFGVVKRFLDAMLPTWHRQVLGVATDGATTMVGNVKGVVTRIEAEAENELTRVWYGLHRLDLKMQIIFQQALQETYLDKLYAVIGYLRRQYNLISEMQSTCPKVADTRWLSMFAVVDWLCRHGYRVRKYLSDNSAACDPNLVWWVFLFAMREVAKEANAVFVSLQGLSTLVQQQQDRFVGLLNKLCAMSGVVGPVSAEAIQGLDSEIHEVAGAFYISHATALAYTQSLGVWVCETMPTLSDDRRDTLVRAVARLCVVTCSNIHALTAEPVASVPVVPRALVNTSMPVFTELLRTHRRRLIPFIGEAGVHKIGQEFKDLYDHYHGESHFRQELDAFDRPLATFEEMWAVGGASVLFPHLSYFCGGLASVFPNTATVESDFSLLGTIKTDKRTGLTDLSVEGILHCKQWHRLLEVANGSIA